MHHVVKSNKNSNASCWGVLHYAMALLSSLEFYFVQYCMKQKKLQDKLLKKLQSVTGP